MAAELLRDESEESLQPQSESDSYATSEEKTDSGLVSTPENTSDTSLKTSDTSGVHSHDIQSSEAQGATKASDGAIEFATPSGKSLISKAKDLAARVARSFSQKKDVKKPKEIADESKPSEPTEKTTPKKSLVQKCMEKIISPKKACNMEASNPSDSDDPPLGAIDSKESAIASASDTVGLHTSQQEEVKSKEAMQTSSCEVSKVSTVDGIETDACTASSQHDECLGARESSTQDTEKVPEKEEASENVARDVERVPDQQEASGNVDRDVERIPDQQEASGNMAEDGTEANESSAQKGSEEPNSEREL